MSRNLRAHHPGAEHRDFFNVEIFHVLLLLSGYF
jgi:hypothetical protein